MSTKKIGTISSGKQDKLITAEIYRFIREFQNIEIRVKPGNAEPFDSVFVHPPFMLQSVTLVNNDEEFNKLKTRHQSRLQGVKNAREAASDEIREFLNRRFYDSNGKERYIACGRAGLEEIRMLLQGAVDQGLVPIPKGKKYPDGDDLRNWLKKYGIGIDCSGFVQHSSPSCLI